MALVNWLGWYRAPDGKMRKMTVKQSYQYGQQATDEWMQNRAEKKQLKFERQDKVRLSKREWVEKALALGLTVQEAKKYYCDYYY